MPISFLAAAALPAPWRTALVAVALTGAALGAAPVQAQAQAQAQNQNAADLGQLTQSWVDAALQQTPQSSPLRMEVEVGALDRDDGNRPGIRGARSSIEAATSWKPPDWR